MDRRSQDKRREIDFASLFVVALFAIMLIGIMALSAIGGGLFDSITENRSDNMNRRSALSYISSKITSSDQTGSLQVEHTQSGDVLVIVDPTKERPYQTRIWAEDGCLMESITSDQAEKISSEPRSVAKVETLRISIDNDIAEVETEDGLRRIHLHSKEVSA
jgi:hypothetical protein